MVPAHAGHTPRTSAAIGERISKVFRVRPDQPPPKASGDSGVYR